MKDVVAVVIKEGYRIVTLPCGMVFPGEICSGVQILNLLCFPPSCHRTSPVLR